MRSLYNLTDAYNNIMELATDESMDLDILESALQEIEMDISTKVYNGIGLIKTLETISKGIKEEESRLSKQRKIIDARVDRIKDWYKSNLEQMGKEKIMTERGTMRIQNNPPALQLDEVKLPPAYFTVIPEHFEVKKEKIKADLKAGIDIPGAYYTQGRSLRIG